MVHESWVMGQGSWGKDHAGAVAYAKTLAIDKHGKPHVESPARLFFSCIDTRVLRIFLGHLPILHAIQELKMTIFCPWQWWIPASECFTL